MGFVVTSGGLFAPFPCWWSLTGGPVTPLCFSIAGMALGSQQTSGWGSPAVALLIPTAAESAEWWGKDSVWDGIRNMAAPSILVSCTCLIFRLLFCFKCSASKHIFAFSHSFQMKFFYISQLAYWLHALPELYFQKTKKVSWVWFSFRNWHTISKTANPSALGLSLASANLSPPRSFKT